jgi:mRNA-degrading endonuclease YafQ of YafQ-DinJ toxin-antitoxin module
VNTFSFTESRYINTLMDYERYSRKRQRIQKCFVEPANKLSIYKKLVNKGYLDIKEGMSYHIQITASDFKGNSSKLVIPIRGKKSNTINKDTIIKTPHFFKVDEFNKINKDNITFERTGSHSDLFK